MNITAFGILALRAASQGDVARSADWLRDAQNSNGGWGFAPGRGSDADSTGAALQALAVAGGSSSALSEGARYLAQTQKDEGVDARRRGRELAVHGVGGPGPRRGAGIRVGDLEGCFVPLKAPGRGRALLATPVVRSDPRVGDGPGAHRGHAAAVPAGGGGAGAAKQGRRAGRLGWARARWSGSGR